MRRPVVAGWLGPVGLQKLWHGLVAIPHSFIFSCWAEDGRWWLHAGARRAGCGCGGHRGQPWR